MYLVCVGVWGSDLGVSMCVFAWGLSLVTLWGMQGRENNYEIIDASESEVMVVVRHQQTRLEGACA